MRKTFLILLVVYGIIGHYAVDAQRPVEELPLELGGEFEYLRDFTCLSSTDEAYLSAQNFQGDISVILRLTKKDGQWKNPVIASFSGQYTDLEPFLSPDGLRLYFASNRPKADTSSLPGDFDLWMVNRPSADAAWSEPVNLGSPVNSEANEFYPSVTAYGNLYFTSDREGSKGLDDIFVSVFREYENRYNPPESLGEAVNTAGYEFNAYIDPEERFLIFTGYNREDGQGSGDLYISRKTASGWQPAVIMTDLNSPKMDYCPFVDVRTGKIYFTSKRVKGELPEQFGSVKEYRDWLDQHGRGASRIYQADFNY